MKFTWAGGTHIGRKRSNNEDTFYPEQDGCGGEAMLVAVADGMGGHAGGEVASRAALDGAVAADGAPIDLVHAANAAVLEAVLEDTDLAGMGTTLTLAKLHPDGRMAVGHVGDSRAYLLRGGRLDQLTIDHNMAQELVEQGKITREEARNHPRSSWLTQALGFVDNLEVEEHMIDLEEGDRLMLCSDGLNGMLPDEQIRPILENGAPSDAVWGLIEAANRAGGNDNITVLVVDIDGGGGGSERELQAST